MEKKIVLVTGASVGIGKSTALLLLKEGYVVYGCARRTNNMNDLEKAGGHALYLDLANKSTIDNVVRQIINEHGRVDVLINNAGYGSGMTIEDVTIEQAKQLFEVNLFGLAYLTQQVLPYMRKNGFGKIVNISSVGGKVYPPVGGWYCASKFALEGWSDVLRLEVKPFGIDVIIIEPGAIKTEFSNVIKKQLDHVPKGTAYQNRYDSIKTYMHRNMNTGSDPMDIAKTILKVINVKKPKTRYAAGYSAGIALFMRKVLSDRVLDKLWERMIK